MRAAGGRTLTGAGSRPQAIFGVDKAEQRKQERVKSARKAAGSRKITALLVLLGLLGLGLLLYPSLADYWNSFHQTRAIMTYAEEVANMNSAEFEKIFQSAASYNEDISKNGIQWLMPDERRERYSRELNFNQNGNMGYIDIPKIDVKLPIYHGTDESVLQTSIGHLEQTSLPVGGEGSHCVLSGHRGLPSAKLFSDLNKLVEGDVFTLSILNETLSYQVDRIRVVEPADLTELRIIPGRDLCTLVTCTPYGINTHRLLVRGHRVDNPDGEAKVIADAIQIDPPMVAPFLAIPLAVLLLLLLAVAPSGGQSRKMTEAEDQLLIETYGRIAGLETQERQQE